MSNDTNINIRISLDEKRKAQEKARSEGLTLSFLVKCFISGYLSGDILGSELVAFREKK